MNKIIEDFKSVKLTRMQKVLAITAILLICMANANARLAKGDNVKDYYFASVRTVGDSVTVGVLGEFIRIK